MRPALIVAVLLSCGPAMGQDSAKCCSERALEYRKIMMPVQRALALAYHAGICRLRSERYFSSLTTSAQVFAMTEARRIGITNAEMADADAAAKQIIAKERKEAGDRPLHETCGDLVNSPKLLQLDEIQRQVTGGYR
jgi:hypothetical protein